MQQLTINISERVVRKLRALSALEGFTSPGQIEGRASLLFEQSLDSGIRSHVGDIPVADAGSLRAVHHQSPVAPAYTVNDGLSDELGDEVDYDAKEPEPETDAFAMVPKKGGLSDKDLDSDMDVEDPQHEAKAEPPSEQDPDDNADEVFIKVWSKPETPEEPLIPADDNWGSKRKKKLKSKAKVTGLNEYTDSPDDL